MPKIPRRRAAAAAVAIGALVGALLAVATPLPAGATDPLPTTLAWTAPTPQALGSANFARLYPITISGPGGTVPVTGIVRVLVNGSEVARTNVTGSLPGYGSASIIVVLPVPADTTPDVEQLTSDITVEYLGDGTYAPSSSTQPATSRNALATETTAEGTLTWGAAAFPIDPSVSFLQTPAASAYDAATGTYQATLTPMARYATAQVDGIGTVTMATNTYGTVAGTVAPDGTFAGSVSTGISVLYVSDGGYLWNIDCGNATQTVAVTGTVTPGGLHIQGSGDGRPPFSACNRADLLNATLGSPSFDFTIHGSFAAPAGPIATTTSLTVEGRTYDTADRLRLTATVGSSESTPTGTVAFTYDGNPVGSAALSGGVAQVIVDSPLPAGTKTIAATYVPTGLFVASSDSRSVTIAPPPAGADATGSFTVAGSTASFGKVVFVSPGTDPLTGEIGASRLWFGTDTFTTPPDLGSLLVNHRLVQVGTAVGQVAPDNTVTFGPVTFSSEARTYSGPASGTLGWDCINQPITVTLTGTAEADAMHLSVTGATLPPVPIGACQGWSSLINYSMGSTVGLHFDVAGDYRRTKVATTMLAGTFQPAVDEGNQSYLVATVHPADATPTSGTVTFADGSTVLGTSPVSADGVATLVATMEQPGIRTVTATYSGDTVHDRATATTTVEVSPAPAGYALDGTLQVGTVGLDIGAGSVIVPQAGTSPGSAADLGAALSAPGARLWFTPATVQLDLPGYGSVTAEVRLSQNGTLDPATLRPDGTFRGLSGAFGLHVRKVTTSTGTTTPLGCIAIVLLDVDGQVRPQGTTLTSTGGSARYPIGSCTGVGRAVLDRLAGVQVALHASATY